MTASAPSLVPCKTPALFRATGKQLRTLAEGSGPEAAAAKAELARRKSNRAVRKAA